MKRNFGMTHAMPAGNNIVRVVGDVSKNISFDELQSSIREQNPRLTAIAGSFVTLNDAKYTATIEGLACIQQESVVLTDMNRDDFKAVASNMYMDEDEKLWSLRRTEAGDILINANAADEYTVMSSLMQSVASAKDPQLSSRLDSLMSANNEVRDALEGGDLVFYAVAGTSEPAMGFVVCDIQNEAGVDQGLAVVSINGEEDQISRGQVISAVASQELDCDDEQDAIEAVAAGNISYEFARDYYKRMFMRSPQYFEAFWSRFKSHAFC